jgi:hypothetical protein
MSNITLGYSDSEDRVWLLLREDGLQMWLTRRLAAALLGRLVQLMEEQCPGGSAVVNSLPAATRLALEHEAALEMAQEEAERKTESETALAETPVANVVSQVVQSVDISVSSERVLLTWHAPGIAVPMNVNRVDGHKLMRAIAHRTRFAGWDFTHLPAWLMAD